MHARTIKTHQKNFVESILFDKENRDRMRLNRQKYRNLESIENKLTPFQIYPETEVAC